MVLATLHRPETPASLSYQTFRHKNEYEGFTSDVLEIHFAEVIRSFKASLIWIVNKKYELKDYEKSTCVWVWLILWQESVLPARSCRWDKDGELGDEVWEKVGRWGEIGKAEWAQEIYN